MEAAQGPQGTGNPGLLFVEVDGITRYLIPGLRLTLGSSRACDLVLEGPGISKHHARLSLHPDGKIWVKPLEGSSLRIGGVRRSRPLPVPPGTEIGIGLVLLRTGRVRNRLAVHLALWWKSFRRSLETAKQKAAFFLLSLFLNTILFLLLFFLITNHPFSLGAGDLRALGIEPPDAASGLEDSPVEEEEEAGIPSPELEEPELESPDTAPEDPDKPSMGEFVVGITGTSETDRLKGSYLEEIGRGKLTTLGGKGSGRRVLVGTGKEIRKTVATLRRTGFEVALLFDSTASMAGPIEEAKNSLQKLLFLFAALVPKTRVGLLTYRDRGDVYVTRQTPLGVGHFQALSFLGSVRAAGGGDLPEAVDKALEVAVRWKWKRGSTKLLVLVGDAPPHPEELKRTLGLAKRFRRSRRGQIHCLQAGGFGNETGKIFEKISRAGGGVTLPLENSRTLMVKLLSLCLNGPPASEVEKLIENVEKQIREEKRRALRAGLPPGAALVAHLGRKSPDPLIVESWSRARPRELASLRGPLSRTRLSREGLQALCYLVNRILQERLPLGLLVNPETLKPPSRGLPQALEAGFRLLERL